MQLLQWQSKGAKNCANCSICRQYHSEGRGGLSSGERKNDVYLCSVNHKRNYSQLLASSTMSQNLTPTFEYQNGSFVSNLATEVVRSPLWHQVECNTGNAEFFDGCPTSGEVGPKDALISDFDQDLKDCCGNNICSSSKSNLKVSSASFKIDTDDSGGCSSSGASVAEKVPDKMLEQDVGISILKSGGVLDRVWTSQDQGENMKNTGVISVNYSSKPCKVCDLVESTLNLLICDNCDDAFHTSCCNPCVTRIPVGEWLCGSCLNKKHKILKQKSTSDAGNISSEIDSYECLGSDELGTIEFMLRDPEPYLSNVRIGDEFQANVPEWSGPNYDDSNLIGYPSEMDPSNNFGMQERDPTEPLKLSSTGNWLQCQEIIDGRGQDAEMICGKWRRAPLFEVQTDDWECFDCIFWDPAHADCAVPQELPTKEVRKQLKYIEMLKPKLSAKRRKLEKSTSLGSQDLLRL